MKRKGKQIIGVIFSLCLLFSVCGCGEDPAEMTEAEKTAAEKLLGNAEFTSVAETVLTEEIAAENDSVTKVYETSEGDYVFFCSPVGYNGPIHIMVAIDGATNCTLGLRIIDHMETEHYVRDMESPWFTDRFADKNAFVYLERVKLEAKEDNQIVAITGSTVTTDAIIKGVNDAFGVYRTIDNPYFKGTPGEIFLTKSDGTQIGTLCADDLKGLESYRRKLVVHTSTGDEDHDYRGVRLSEAISLADASLLSSYEKVSVIGTDAYAAELEMDEILLENNVYLMYEDYGEPIQTIAGQDGGLRLVILKDDYGQRFTDDVLELRFQ